jgi:putative PIN family toxin of toxin-antitoxin system
VEAFVIRAVFDSNVVIGGVIWRGESHLCLVAMARRRARVFTSPWILEEVRRSVRKLEELGRTLHDPWPSVNWFCCAAHLVEPAPTGKQRSRDPKDEPILGTALASGVKTIVTFDEDLLVLEKPFGIEIVRPGWFLQSVA